MRDLTQQEIDNAPKWATHYFMIEGEHHIRWQNNKELKYSWSNDASPWSKRTGYPFSEPGKPIPRKEFNILGYEFDDRFNIDISEVDDCDVNIDVNGTDTYITKEDTIALAKHFKLTAEDL